LIQELGVYTKVSSMRLVLKSFEAGWVKAALILYCHPFEKCA